MAKLLAPPEVREALKGLEGWEREGKFIVKTYEFRTFAEGIGFVNRLARVADSMDHHPDIYIVYATIKLSIQTHSEGGITAKDIRLARSIDKIIP